MFILQHFGSVNAKMVSPTTNRRLHVLTSMSVQQTQIFVTKMLIVSINWVAMSVDVTMDSMVMVIRAIQKGQRKQLKNQHHNSHQLNVKMGFITMTQVERAWILTNVHNIRVYAMKMPIALID